MLSCKPIQTKPWSFPVQSHSTPLPKLFKGFPTTSRESRGLNPSFLSHWASLLSLHFPALRSHHDGPPAPLPSLASSRLRAFLQQLGVWAAPCPPPLLSPAELLLRLWHVTSPRKHFPATPPQAPEHHGACFKAGAPYLWDLTPDDLRWGW